jgi:hypothetical protein
MHAMRAVLDVQPHAATIHADAHRGLRRIDQSERTLRTDAADAMHARAERMLGGRRSGESQLKVVHAIAI